ncbi:transglutaminase-like domain-containing protein [Angustibacter luteus]|uniref:Transglutaminase family protein n=1 Tax=Angustibacter luteus TaxID=658456 RepID=A0ABW1JD13_9ACTN
MRRHVTAELDLEVAALATLELQVAVATRPDLTLDEQLSITLDGEPLPVREVETQHGSRVHLLESGAGAVQVRYRATIDGRAPADPASDVDVVTARRPSRYAHSDALLGFALKEFGPRPDVATLLPHVASWVGTHLDYIPGSSRGTDGATQTLLAGAGVCRDYAHLVIALLRALDVPARLAAVYAPGLAPMDFHAVAEAVVDGRWRVVDATCLAPRSTLLRISTGRDAADTAFLTTYGGDVLLSRVEVSAVVDGELPTDDVRALVSLG